MSYATRLRLLFGKKSMLFLSSKPDNVAVVFVHGFGGSATGTWTGFEKLASSYPGWDLIFYGYPSWSGQASSHAEFFRGFLTRLLREPTLVHPELVRQYRHILLVGHSLGAIVLRRALLNASFRGEDFLDRVSFALFAPVAVQL